MTRNVGQTAELFAVSQHTVLAWIGAGELRAVNVARSIGGRPRWRITDAAITQFESLRSASTVPQPARRPRRKSREKVTEYYKV